MRGTMISPTAMETPRAEQLMREFPNDRSGGVGAGASISDGSDATTGESDTSCAWSLMGFSVFALRQRIVAGIRSAESHFDRAADGKGLEMMGVRQPLVSVILPTYNRAALLSRAIGSILSQSFENFELIVVNDASTDGTRELLDREARRDVRIRAIHNEQNDFPDLSKLLNRALEVATGTYVARLDDDDYWCATDKLAKQVEFLSSHPEHVAIGGGVIVVDKEDREIFRYRKAERDEEIRDRALFANPLAHPTAMFVRELAIAVGGYGNQRFAEDWDLWLRMGLRGRFHNHQDYFVRYRVTAENKSLRFHHQQAKVVLRMLARYRNRYPHFTVAFASNLLQYGSGLVPSAIRQRLRPPK
jgi:glycosyltransferase involved in cell wall biosynthesis